MALNYKKINEEIIKLARGLGYRVEMYDEKGAGPINTPEKAKYVYLQPENIAVSLPQGYTSEFDEVYVYTSKDNKNMNSFVKFIKNLQKVCHINGLGVTIRNFENKDSISDYFVQDAKRNKEENS